MRSFEDLVAEAESADVTGWGFDWLTGRAVEERPPWVPDFSVAKYRQRLIELDARLRSGQPFVAHSSRHLVDARRPG